MASPSAAYEDAVEALLIDRFKLTPDEIDALSDADVHDKYFHKRDDKGSIVFPPLNRNPLPLPMTPEEKAARQLWELETLAGALGVNDPQQGQQGMIDAASLERTREELRRRAGKSTG